MNSEDINMKVVTFRNRARSQHTRNKKENNQGERWVSDKDKAENPNTCNMTQMNKSI